MFTFDQIIKRSYHREKHIHAPLLEERLSYLQHWLDRGTSLHTIRSIAQYLLRIIEFLHLEKYRVITLGEIEKSSIRWAEYQYNHPQKRDAFSKTGKERFIRYALDWLKKLNRLEPLPEERIPLFNKIFERRKALQRHTAAPLLKERIMYLKYWNDNGAKEGTLRRIAQYLLVIMDYLGFCKIRIASVNEIEKAAEHWAKNKAIHRRESDCSKFAKGRFINDATRWFEMLGCLEPQGKQPIPFEGQAGHKSPIKLTADFVYLRLHGPTEFKYQGSYSDAVLKKWSKQCIVWRSDKKDVYVYFDNDQNAYAAFNALKLKRLVENTKLKN